MATVATPLDKNVSFRQVEMPTNTHNSFASDGAAHDYIVDARGKGRATIAVHNLSNQTVTATVYGAHTSADDPGETGVFPIGSAFTVAAAAVGYETLNDPFPYYIVRLSTPAAGDAALIHLYINAQAY